MNGQPKLHHYVPQFYLRQWCDEAGKLVVYPLDGRPPFRSTPRNVAAECNLYTPLRGAPAVRDDHEQRFSGWEGHFSKVWPDIFDRAQNPKTRKNLARFLATLSFVIPPRARWSVKSTNDSANSPAVPRTTHALPFAGGTATRSPVSPQRFLVIADEWEWPFVHYKLDDERVFIRRVVGSAARFVFAQRENPLIAQAIAARKAPTA